MADQQPRDDGAPPPPDPNGETRSSAPVAVDVYQPASLAPRADVDAGAFVLAARAEAEIKARALIAISRPRQMLQFRRKLLEACERTRFADAAIYEVPRGLKTVDGFSIRFAEECARLYGNLDIGSFVISDNDQQRVIECCVVDLETNAIWRRNVVVPKSIERKQMQRGDQLIRERHNARGERLFVIRATEEQILSVQNALISKTTRVLILNHIPSDIQEEARDKMESVLAGEAKNDPIGFRKRIVDSFYKFGIMPAQLEELLGKSIDDANEAELVKLGRIGRGIETGETTWVDIMRDAARRPSPTSAGISSTQPEKDVPKGAGARLADRLTPKEGK